MEFIFLIEFALQKNELKHILVVFELPIWVRADLQEVSVHDLQAAGGAQGVRLHGAHGGSRGGGDEGGCAARKRQEGGSEGSKRCGRPIWKKIKSKNVR